MWTCCAAVALRTERLLLGPMVTPLARRRPQVLAHQVASLAVLSVGRFVLGLGLGDDGLGEFSAYGDEPDPRVRAQMLDEGLDLLTALLSGEPVHHQGVHYTALDVQQRPAVDVPVWLAGRFGNRAPVRRAARRDGFFVIGLDEPGDLDQVTAGLAAHDPAPGFEVVVDVRPEPGRRRLARPGSLVGADPDRPPLPRPRRRTSGRRGWSLSPGPGRTPTWWWPVTGRRAGSGPQGPTWRRGLECCRTSRSRTPPSSPPITQVAQDGLGIDPVHVVPTAATRRRSTCATSSPSRTGRSAS